MHATRVAVKAMGQRARQGAIHLEQTPGQASQVGLAPGPDRTAVDRERLPPPSAQPLLLYRTIGIGG